MKEKYSKIWELAKPYYKKGRAYDIPHIEWMMEEADKLAEKKGLNKDLLMPIVILHDVGYASVGEKNPNIKSKRAKKLHMKEGAKTADKVLSEVGYAPELKEKVVHYISVHDNWILGDDSPFKECKEMAAFNDLDFLWVTTIFEVFKGMAESMDKTPEEFYEFWTNDEKLERRPFCCEHTKKMWTDSIEKIRNKLDLDKASD